MIDGEEFALGIGTVSTLSSNPLSLAARVLADGTTSKDELPTAFPTGVYGCARCGPLVGVLAGTKDPSEIGISAASLTKVLNRGGPGIAERPRSFLSISARLVLALILLLIRGLKDDPQYQQSHGHVRAQRLGLHLTEDVALRTPAQPCLSGRRARSRSGPFRGRCLITTFLENAHRKLAV